MVQTGLRMAAGGVTLGHPGKRDARGEDAFFVCATGLGAVGVADGVGSWIVDGIDAGDFSRCWLLRVLDEVPWNSHGSWRSWALQLASAGLGMGI